MKIKNSDTQYAGLVIAMHWLMLVVLALVYACMCQRRLKTDPFVGARAEVNLTPWG
ncbi:hypothetical protein [Achromobacter xylosoxidans]|uniref:hypothetical protein n=1 Tax=Alcaligenes xylosoxydans xylosoxydans TaxID=85698 RepID=UPI001F3158CE|nr:hypothetical protein [Achromobacter xylosoxidans]